MKAILKTSCVGIVLIAAFAVKAQTLTYSNSIVVPGGNPPTAMAFNLPQFNPANGTLDSVTLTMYSSFQFLFTYNGLSASGELTLTETNSFFFLYRESDVLSQRNFVPMKFTAALPLQGRFWVPPADPTLQGQSAFSAAADLANFTGTGQIPLSAEYYNQPTVTWTSGTVTWSQDASATMAAVVDYDFTPAPEPGVVGMMCFGMLGFALLKCRYWRQLKSG